MPDLANPNPEPHHVEEVQIKTFGSDSRALQTVEMTSVATYIIEDRKPYSFIICDQILENRPSTHKN